MTTVGTETHKMGLGAAAQAPRQSVGDRLLRIGPWLLLITIALDLVGLVLGVTTRVGAQPFAVQPPAAVIAAVSLSLSYGVVGRILTSRVPLNRVGWLLTAVGIFSALTILGWYYASHAFATVASQLPSPDVVIFLAMTLTPVRQRLERLAGHRLQTDETAAASPPPALDMDDKRTRELVEAVADRAAELATQRTLAALRASEPRATEPDTPITAGSHEA